MEKSTLRARKRKLADAPNELRLVISESWWLAHCKAKHLDLIHRLLFKIYKKYIETINTLQTIPVVEILWFDISNFSYLNSRWIIKSPKQRLETYCFCSVSYYYYYYSCSCSCSSPFFPCTMNLSTADLRNYRTEFHETWWSYRYMFLVDPKVFRFVVKGVKAIFWVVQRGWGLL